MNEVRPDRSKAEFRALREMVGLTHQAMADRLGVKIMSVKRWESPKYPQIAPVDAWRLLDGLSFAQGQKVADAVARASEAGSATVPYWSAAATYDGTEPGAEATWTEANATSRRVASVLLAQGVPVQWVCDPDGTASAK